MFISYSPHSQPYFRDRLDAARQLLQKLMPSKNEDCVVVALPRGGVPIAYQIARAIHAPLHILSVRKLGSPDQPELAIGAITSDGTIQFNVPLVQSLDVDPRELFDIVETEREMVLARQKQYDPFQSEVNFHGKTVIIVDDGLATGMTMQAAVESVKRRQPQKIVAAAPVCAAQAARTIRQQVDELVCPHQPAEFISVGLWYQDFAQVSDDEVLALLKSANKQELSPN